MIATHPHQELVDRVARDLAPDVIRSRFSVGQDWSEHHAIYYRVVLSDEATRPERLAGVTGLVRARLLDEFGLSTSDLIPYFRFRSESEQAKLKEQSWD